MRRIPKRHLDGSFPNPNLNPYPSVYYAHNRAGVRNVKDYDAVGDGVTDDTDAVFAAMYATAERETLFFPSGQYYVTKTIKIGHNTQCICDGEILFHGGGEPCFMITAPSESDGLCKNVVAILKMTDDEGTNTGVLIENAQKCHVTIPLCTDFVIGIAVHGDALNCENNTIQLGDLTDCATGIKVYRTLNASDGGRVRQNTFIGGQISSTAGDFGISVLGDANGYLPERNSFISIGLSGTPDYYVSCNGIGNYFNMCHYASSAGTKSVLFGANSASNAVCWAYGLDKTLDVTDNGTGNIYLITPGDLCGVASTTFSDAVTFNGAVDFNSSVTMDGTVTHTGVTNFDGNISNTTGDFTISTAHDILITATGGVSDIEINSGDTMLIFSTDSMLIDSDQDIEIRSDNSQNIVLNPDGDLVVDAIIDYTGAMGNSAKDPTSDAPDDWVQIEINGTVQYIPTYDAS